MSGGLASVTVDVRGLNCPIRAFAQIEGFPCEVSEAPPGVWCFRLSKP